MRLYISPMDAVLVEVDQDGRVRFDGEDWSVPTLQEQRAILYSAQNQVSELKELIDILGREGPTAGLEPRLRRIMPADGDASRP